MPYIRPVQLTDDPALSRICLLTGDAGKSAEPYHSIPDLLGLIFALPYNHRFDITFGFVLVEDSDVVGYILGTRDSVQLRELEGKEWWPALREKYPLQVDSNSGTSAAAATLDSSTSGRTEADNRLIQVLHSPYVDPPAITDPYPAHIHIDILPSHQRKGYGRDLMASAVEYLRSKGHSGLFVGLDPNNNEAKKFYARLGFQRIDLKGGEWWGLDFERFHGGMSHV